MKSIPAALALALVWTTAAGQPVKPASGPVVIAVADHDVSPNLRDISPFRPPEPEPLREFHEDREREEERARAPWILLEARRGSVKDQARQTAVLPPAALTLGLNFDGIGNGVHGFQVSGAPPDTNGAVGASQYVQSVNSSLAVYDKHSGALLLGPLDFRTLYAGFGGLCETNSGSDPVVLYDKLADRWIVSILVSANNGGPDSNFECFAVSTTSDATGSYNRYAIPFGTRLNDFPKLGVWPEAYYFAANPFDQADGGRLVGRNLCAIDRQAALDGAPLSLICFVVPLAQTSGAVLPTDIDGPAPPPPGTPNLFYVLGGDFASLRFYKFHADFADPEGSTLTGPFDIPVAPFNRLCPGGACVPQAGSTQMLSSIGDVPNFRVAYRNFGSHQSLVLNHSVRVDTVAGVRWYEIRDPAGAATLFQQGTFVPDGSGRWMGSVATDKAGNIALGYSVSGPTLNPAIGITGRAPSDPPGAMATEQIAFAGAGAQTPSLDRWGDYSGMTVDPQNDCTFWYTTEYIPANGNFNWRTRIVSFTMPGCVSEPQAAVSPRSLSFGSLGVGTASAAQAVTLTNAGPGSLTLGGITASGDFSQIHDCGPALAEGASCTIEVVFTPAAAGTRQGTLTVTDSSSNGPHRSGLTGTGLGAGGGATAIDFAGGFGGPGLTLNGGAVLNGTRLRLTDGGINQARSAFFTTAVPVQFFTTDFTFQLTSAIADGFTLTFQGNGPTRVGPGGSGLGYGGTTGGIPNSVAVKLDLANSAGEGGSSTGVYTGGAPPTVPALNLIPSGINLHTGDVFFAHVTYDGNTLAWTISNATTGKSFSAAALVDIPAEVGGPTAFVGFTGGTGGGANTAIQDILTWTFQTPGVVAPFVSLAPRGQAFGTQEAGTTSAAQPVTVTNHGPGVLTITSIATEGDFTRTHDCPPSLAEGAGCTVNVSFAPAAAGTRQGALVVTDDAFNGAQRARLIGTGLAAGVPVVVDYRAGFGGPGLSLNNGASIEGTRLRITTNATGQARSAFTLRPVNVASFSADFTFQNTSAIADGFTFAIQRNAPTALGGTGGALGYAGIPNSVAVKFDIFSSNGEGTSSTGLYLNGAFPSVPALNLAPAGIILRSNDVFYVHLGYDGAVLSWTITNARTGDRFATSAAIDIPAVIGGPAAFVGFTGGTGGLTATQDILTWTFQTAGTTGPHALLAPVSLFFGNQTVGTSSAPQPLTLSNTGPGSLAIGAVTAGAGFTQTNDCGTSLAEGATCSVDVVFHPTVSGSRVAALTVASDAAINPQVARLSGVGVVPGGAVTVNYGGGFTATGLTLNGAAINGGRLRITDGGNGQARSAFFTTRVDARAFVNDFSFQLASANADGFTFTLQGNAPTSVGGSGGGLGYGPPNPDEIAGGIPNSVAVKFDLYDSEGEGANSTGLFTGGVFPGLPATDLTGAGIDLHSGAVLDVHMTYDGAVLTWTLTNPASGGSLTRAAAVDIPTLVGAPTAFVGFTGGTGGLSAIQDVLSWTYQTTSTAPLALLAPRQLAFGRQTVGASSSSAPQALTLLNRGPGPLSLAGISVTGDFAQANDCGASLAENASCVVNVTFTPSAPGTRLGTLTVADDAFLNPQSASLVGIGLHPAPLAVDFAAGFAPGGLTLNGGAAVEGARLRITDGGNSQARSAFFTTPVSVESFLTDFTFLLTDAVADGLTFTVQGVGPTAVGPDGGALGYAGIANSAAVKFDLFDTAGEGFNSTGLYTDGALPTVPAEDLTPSGIDLHSGRVLYVHVSYDGTALAWTVTDPATGAVFSRSATVDIADLVGGPTAFVGFTGGTGGFSAIQDILTWTFQSGTTPLRARLEPATLAFGDQTLGTTSAARLATLTNDGPGSLTLAGIAVSGDYAHTSNCAPVLAARVSCTLQVTFAPGEAGFRKGTLGVTSNASNSPHLIVLSGTGVPVATTVSLGSSLPVSTFGQPVTLTAALSPAVMRSGISPTGTVSFKEGGTTLATVFVKLGRARFTTATLGVGTHMIVAEYSGDSIFSPASSAPFAQVVNPAPIARKEGPSRGR